MVTNLKSSTIRRAMAALVIPAFTISGYAAHNSFGNNARSNNASYSRPMNNSSFGSRQNSFRQPAQMAMAHNQGVNGNRQASGGNVPANRPAQNAQVNRTQQNTPVNRTPQNSPNNRPPQNAPVSRTPQNPPISRTPQNPPISRTPQYPPNNGRGGDGRGPRGPEYPRNHVAGIPRDRFKSNFGGEHSFHMERPVMVAGHPHFYRDGFSFAIMAPAPPAWIYSDAVYVDSIDGAYYLCNPRFPGVHVALSLADPNAAPVPAPAPVPYAQAQPQTDNTAGDQQAPDSNTVAVGQTIDQVVSVLGYPKSVVDMGIRKIYLYDNMRVTFIAGRMADAR
jgi:hypothetical protein